MSIQQINSILLFLVLMTLIIFFSQMRRYIKNLQSTLSKHGKQKNEIARCSETINKLSKEIKVIKRADSVLQAIAGLRDYEKEQAELSGDEMTMVLSLPKCGSATLISTIATVLQDKANIHHCHYISRRGSDEWFDKLRQFCNPQDDTALIEMIRASANESRKYRQLINEHPNRKINLIGGLREPIGLLVSFWFQFRYILNPPVPSDVTADEIRDWVMNAANTNNLPFLPFEKWFDQEYKFFSDVDVLTEDFDIDRGYQIYKSGNTQICLIRVDHMKSLPKMLGDIFEMPSEVIINKSSNIAEDKSYGETYKRVVQTLRFPREFIDKIYSTPYSLKFWSRDELTNYALNWEKGSGFIV